MWNLLRTNHDIRSLFAAQVVSFMGDWFAYVAFVGLVQDVTDAPILVTMVYVAQALPAFLMAAIAGPAADRFDRRNIIRIVSVVQAVAAAGLLLVDSAGRLWFGFVCLCVISALGSFVGPSAQAGLPNLARTPEELTKAALLFGSLWGAMLAIGAAAGGVVASVFGRDVAFIANALSFVVAAGAVTLIKRPMQNERAASAGPAPRMRPIADMREAFGYARRDSVLLSLLASKATFAMGAGIVGLLAVLATEELGGGDAATGVLIGARGVGVALGPLIAARLVGPSMSRVLLLCGGAGLAFGVCYLGLSVAPALAIAVPFTFLAHLGGGAQWTLSTYGLQRRAPDHVRGRILAGDFGIVTLIITLSHLAAGALAGVVGARVAIATFATLGLAAGTAYLVLTRPVRARLALEERSEPTIAPAG
ncbi:MAG: MFS transporter [Actinobacteria bacterium]|nr:MFS transporter [Actinomycetota bacterium]